MRNFWKQIIVTSRIIRLTAINESKPSITGGFKFSKLTAINPKVLILTATRDLNANGGTYIIHQNTKH